MLDHLKLFLNRLTGNRTFGWFKWCRVGRGPLTEKQVALGREIARKRGWMKSREE